MGLRRPVIDIAISARTRGTGHALLQQRQQGPIFFLGQ